MVVRHLLFLIFLTSSFTNLSGCKKRSATPDDTVVIGIAAAPPTLDPRFARDSIGINVRSLLFSALVRVHVESPQSPISVASDLAKTWSYNNLVFHFDLHPGVTFGDGTPLTAEDIEFSFREYQKDANPYASAFKKIKNVRATYDGKIHTVDITVDHYESTFLMDLSVVQMLPKKIVEAHDKDFYNHLQGTGAFELVSSNDNELLFRSRSQHYRNPKIQKPKLNVTHCNSRKRYVVTKNYNLVRLNV